MSKKHWVVIYVEMNPDAHELQIAAQSLLTELELAELTRLRYLCFSAY